MGYLDKIDKMTSVEELSAELVRQRDLLKNQEQRYRNTRPKARFAVAAHMTKTRIKMRRLESRLIDRDVPLVEVLKLTYGDDYL